MALHLGVTRGQHVGYLTIVYFVERKHCYKLIATQIPHDDGLAPIPFTRRKCLSFRKSNLRRIP